MILGLHCGVRDGYDSALRQASEARCGVMQVLPYRRHGEDNAAERAVFKNSWRGIGCKRVIAHSRFVPSLASSDDERRGRSQFMLLREFHFAWELGADAFILHAGAYSPGASKEEGLKLCTESIAQAVKATGTGISVIVENVPGGGRRLGGTLEDLAELLKRLADAGVSAGVCLDTAHAWAAGYDLASAEGMLRWLSRVHRVLGSSNVRAFHLSDTRAGLGSHREHHEHWGEGYLGAEGLKVLLARPEYADLPGILETPLGGGADRRNLDFVGALNLNR